MVIKISLSSIIEAVSNEKYLIFMVVFAIIAFLLSGVGYYYLVNRLRRFKGILSEAFNQEETIEGKMSIINEKLQEVKLLPKQLKQTWNRYFSDYNAKRDDVTLDPFLYFDEPQFVLRAGYRKLLEAIPAIFVSLGILGTFWGITTGISDINPNAGVEGMQAGINELLSSMRFAFYSSIAGIIISLFFQLFDRMVLYPGLVKNTDDLFNEIEKVIPVEQESNYLNKIASTQEAQFNSLRKFFSDEFLPKLTSGISESVSQSLEPHLEKSNEIMENVAQSTKESQSDALKEMTDGFMEALQEMSGDHIKDLGDALHKTVEWQEKVHNEMSGLVEELSNVAEKQAEMAKNTTELSEQMNEYTETLANYQDSLSESTSDLNTITEKNTALLEQMESIYSEMTQRNRQDEERFTERINQMNTTVERITGLGSAFTELQEETKLATEILVDATDSMTENVDNNHKLNESLREQHKLSNEWNVKTHELLEDVSHNSNISEEVQKTLDDLYDKVSSERKSLDDKQAAYNSLIENSRDDLIDMWDDNKNLLHDNKEQFMELNNVLSQSMNDFAEHMSRGVQGTFNQFDKELNKAVDSLAKGVSSIDMVVQSIEDDMSNVNDQIGAFNNAIGKLATGARK